MQKVENKDKRNRELDHYIYVSAKFYDTGVHVDLLFTEIELSDMEKIHIPVKFKNNVLYKAKIAYKTTFIWYSKHLNHVFRISPSQLDKAIKRANDNLEDLPKKNLFQRILGLWKDLLQEN